MRRIPRKFILEGAPLIRLHSTPLNLSAITVKSVEHTLLDKSNGETASFGVVFRSPTFFRETQKGGGLLASVIPRKLRRTVRPVYRYVIVPDPYHFFRGLTRLYRNFCNPHFRYRSYCEWLLDGGVALETYRGLQVFKVWDNDKRWYRGFVGRAVFTIPRDLYDPKMAKLTQSLLEFARYSNVGGNRTAGFGVVSYRPLAGAGHPSISLTSGGRGLGQELLRRHLRWLRWAHLAAGTYGLYCYSLV